MIDGRRVRNDWLSIFTLLVWAGTFCRGQNNTELCWIDGTQNSLSMSQTVTGCAFIRSNSATIMILSTCTANRFYFCHDPSDTLCNTNTAGWDFTDSLCIRIVQTNQGWDVAATECQALGSDTNLVVLTDASDLNAFIDRLDMETSGVSTAWIGLASCAQFVNCPDGFNGTQFTRSIPPCTDIDECLSNPCDDICTNTNGSFACSCSSGSIDPSNMTSCLNLTTGVDECTTLNDTCPVGQTCIDTPDAFQCICNLVFDIDFCLSLTRSCDVDNGECEQTCVVGGSGLPICSCANGYMLSLNGRTCLDVDECLTDPCPLNNTCINTIGSYLCVCPEVIENTCSDTIRNCSISNGGCAGLCVEPGICNCSDGLTLSLNGFSCEDIDECLDADINCIGGECCNTYGSFKCFCPTGYTLNGTVCEVAERNCSINNGGCAYTCSGNTCSCPSGLDLSDDGVSCVDIDECLDAGINCIGGECCNTHGSFKCFCPTGYTLNGTVCEVAERNCSINNGGCAYTCSGNTCSCPSGLDLSDDGVSCVDIDECLDAGINCIGGECCNTHGSFKCFCPTGYTLNGTVCEVAERNCSINNGGCAYTCSGNTCSCPSGLDLSDDGVSCVDIDECLDAGINCIGGECCNTHGSFKCFCPTGYTLNGTVCEVAERNCSINNGGCADTCSGNTCSCPSGLDLSDDGVSCVDMDECETDTMCVADGKLCINTYGSYVCVCEGNLCNNTNKDCNNSNGGCQQVCDLGTCDCNDGFVLNANGLDCDDIDECNNTANCPGEQCVNTLGSFSCVCSNCSGGGPDIDECDLDSSLCTPHGICFNTIGSFICWCPPPFMPDGSGGCNRTVNCTILNGGCQDTCTMDGCNCSDGFSLSSNGLTCEDIDECDTIGCDDPTQLCVNTYGSFVCVCQGFNCQVPGRNCSIGNGGCQAGCTNGNCNCGPGRTLGPDGVSCIDDDECDNSPCMLQCINTPGSFECLCKVGSIWDGSSCVRNCSIHNGGCADRCTPAGTCVCDDPFAQLSPDGVSCLGGSSNSSGNNCPGFQRWNGTDCITICDTDNNGGCEGRCEDNRCVCDPGLTLSNNSISCVDIDECANGMADCSPEQTCINTQGSFKCRCEPDHFRGKCKVGGQVKIVIKLHGFPYGPDLLDPYSDRAKEIAYYCETKYINPVIQLRRLVVSSVKVFITGSTRITIHLGFSYPLTIHRKNQIGRAVNARIRELGDFYFRGPRYKIILVALWEPTDTLAIAPIDGPCFLLKLSRVCPAQCVEGDDYIGPYYPRCVCPRWSMGDYCEIKLPSGPESDDGLSGLHVGLIVGGALLLLLLIIIPCICVCRPHRPHLQTVVSTKPDAYYWRESDPYCGAPMSSHPLRASFLPGAWKP